MNQGTSLYAHTVTATAALTAKRGVTIAGAVPGAAATCLGPARTNAAIGERVAVDCIGSAPWESGGVFAAGDYLQVDASGRVVVFAAGVKVGKALEASSGAGQFPEVLLLQN